MAVDRRRRFTALATAAAAVTLTAALATGCDPNDSLDCLTDADSIGDSITAINQAGADAIEDPTRTEDSITTIEKNLDKINDQSDDGKVDKAVGDLNKAIEDYNKAILNGDTNPDSSKIDAAADRLKTVCTP
ncbi:hypothetical protein OOK36_43995 [Streptomyces sp. NBC_00365]|uniref:hypothetical protein n=1 Tax=Streptomyces sp. NBC_00365 TaxID=2975726 RepID=UPI00225C0D71|nr:hypothetical protein [Streptomyces sp. NBC_00365]MCX5095680.1 hypothetical protein [Streptomyces sp. NBC_00365]